MLLLFCYLPMRRRYRDTVQPSNSSTPRWILCEALAKASGDELKNRPVFHQTHLKSTTGRHCNERRYLSGATGTAVSSSIQKLTSRENMFSVKIASSTTREVDLQVSFTKAHLLPNMKIYVETASSYLKVLGL